MKQLLSFLAALAVCLGIAFGVRLLALTVCTAPAGIGRELRRGDRVLVNRMLRNSPFHRGDIIAFNPSIQPKPQAQSAAPKLPAINPQCLGLVIAEPGDTISYRGARYKMPVICCARCMCADCHLYLVATATDTTLVHQHEVVGRATYLFHLPF